MKRLLISILIVVVSASVSLMMEVNATEYTISGEVKTMAGAPIEAPVSVWPKDDPTAQRSGTTAATNGLYTVVIDVPSNTVVNVEATGFPAYYWIREVTLVDQPVVSNVNFAIPTVNTQVVSVVGLLTVQGIPPTNYALAFVRKQTAIGGQYLEAICPIAILGNSITNEFRFLDLPAGDYDFAAQVDSSSTQLVISVTATNVPLQLNIDF